MPKIQIVEVGPRDGWQNLKQLLSFEEKTHLIDMIIGTGINEMEVTSFVNPKVIPQMADSTEVANYCIRNYPNVKFWALAPNYRGAKNAYTAGIRNIEYVISVSETHNKANINKTHDESIQDLKRTLDELPDANIMTGLATAFGCPFEGIPSQQKVLDFCGKLYETGIRSMLLGDTIGIGDPHQVRNLVSAVIHSFSDCSWQVHIHDTRGMGLVNTLAAIECGITTVQSTLGGLGGCPFAPGASGNIATEDLVYMLERMGYSTGIRFEKLLTVAKYQKSFVEGIYSGHHINIENKTKKGLGHNFTNRFPTV